MNQLQNLLHDSLIATGHVENCAIIRRNDASLRAASVGFVVRFHEMFATEIKLYSNHVFKVNICKQLP